MQLCFSKYVIQANSNFQRAKNYMHMYEHYFVFLHPPINIYSATKPQNPIIMQLRRGHKVLNAQDIHSLVLWSSQPHNLLSISTFYSGLVSWVISAIKN